uniref:Uncharacterized protein LOC105057391 n=1 Tax=Elaeis guineensis var. tenera TaxID=51953 RepID=A0A6I9S696_ELAGV|nr:uncharacterized protein LOC105057391 [Elaeis guineensis]XP_010938292.1 uncharacterized protein LOC105057391 [Elaeis guineensis]
MMGESFGLEGSFEWAEKEGPYTSLLALESPMLQQESRPKDSPEEPEPNPNCKRQKIDSCIDMTEEPSPLGLILRKTPSFLDLLQMRLSQKKITPLNEPTSSTRIAKQKTRNDKCNTQPIPMKWKASNFPASKLKIGSWERKSTNEGDIVAKFYYAKRKLVWEILEERLKQKLEIQWTDISAIRARFTQDQPGILEVELRQQPVFFNEVNPQPRKHTNWEACSDFTGGNATSYRRHYLEFPEGILEKHYERLLRSDGRLLTLSQNVFASHDSQFFETINRDMQDTCMFNPKFPPILNQPSSNWCSPHLNHIDNQGSAPTHIWTFESLDPSVGANHPHSLLKPTPGVMQMNSPMSVMEYPPPMDQAASCLNPRISYLDNFALNNGTCTTNSTLNRMTQLCDEDIQSLRSIDDISEPGILQLPSGAYATPAPNFLPRRVSANNLSTDIAETENFHAPIQDLQSLEEQLLSDSDDLDTFASDDSRLLSKVKSIGSLIAFEALPDSQPRSSNGLDDSSNQNTDGTDSPLESRDSRQFDNEEQTDISSLFQRTDHVDSHSVLFF